MKSAAVAPGKRRRRPGVAVVVLVFCSLLVPLAFLFNRFPSGYVIDDGPKEFIFQTYDSPRVEEELIQAIKDSKTVPGSVSPKVDATETTHLDYLNETQRDYPAPEINRPKPPPVPLEIFPPQRPEKRNRSSDADESEKSCELEFGSYCLWSIEHREVMRDSVVKRLKDQLFIARAYYPSIGKISGKELLTRDLKQSIQDHEKVLSESIVDADLPSNIGEKIETMEQVLSKAKSCSVDCNNVDRKLRQIFDLTEDEAHFHMKQSAFLYNLGVQTMPKSHHCLTMRLTVEYFKASPLDPEMSHAGKFNDPKYQHYVIFSKNVIAASVVVNSTYFSSEVKGGIVFHVLTDAENYYAMKYWFVRNSPNDAALQVINYEEYILRNFPYFDLPQLYLPEEFRVLVRNIERPIEQTRMEYLSVFSHSHFFLPEIFSGLRRVIVLDDDVVVQGDMSLMWNLDMGDKVNGALEFCQLRLGQLKPYMGRSEYDPQSCAWISGINIIDFDKWREQNVSEKYMQLLQQFKSKDEVDARSAAFPLSLLTFENLVYPLDPGLILSGLGYDYDAEMKAANSAILLHYNGNMKPWLELGIPGYKQHWNRFLTREERFMDECNVHP